MVPRIVESLSLVVDFLNCQHRFARIDGFLHDLEGYALYQLAAVGGGSGAIVEIGSYLGRSTSFLAAGSKAAGRAKVFAVDHFLGSPEQQPGQAFASAVLSAEGTTLHKFNKNIRSLELDDYVVPIVGKSTGVVQDWLQPVRLLFIDGDHSYDCSRRDFEMWSPFVVKHGVVCFHDVHTWPGVTKFYQELLSKSSDYREVAAVNSLRVVEKLTGGTVATFGAKQK